MEKETETEEYAFGIDKGLIAMFLKMTPEERLQANNNAIRAIMELRNAFRQRTTGEPGSGRVD